MTEWFALDMAEMATLRLILKTMIKQRPASRHNSHQERLERILKKLQ